MPGEVKSGDKVGIIGFGGLGQIGAQVAVLAGANVYVAEVNESIWDNIHRRRGQGVAKSIHELGDDFDVIVDYAGFGTTTAAAIENVRLGGRVVQVGMGTLEATISTNWLILKSVTLIGSQGGTIETWASTNASPPARSTPSSPRSPSTRFPTARDCTTRRRGRSRMVALY